MKKFLTILSLSFFIGGFMSLPSYAENAENHETAIFAGGCFWCIEKDFEKLSGVATVVSGYTGGTVENPSYKQVSRGGTKHYEAVKVTFDPAQVTYAQLADYFWRHIDPFDDKGQFCDKGDQYRAAIFYDGDRQKKDAEASKLRAEKELGQKVVTQLLPTSTFYEAEGYHQDYYKKNSTRYKFYRWNCGRDQRVKEVWQKVSGH